MKLVLQKTPASYLFGYYWLCALGGARGWKEALGSKMLGKFKARKYRVYSPKHSTKKAAKTEY